MRDWQGKRYWLVGASEGLGRALALKMSRAGAEVILSARSTDRLEALAAELPGRSSIVGIDVSDPASVAAAAEAAGQIDGLVYLAGVYWPMKATEWDTQKAEAMADVNFTGGLRVVGAVIDQMIERGQGHIVLTGSLAGFRGLPGSIGYGASKAALMCLAESLHADLRQTDILVQQVNPGFIKTRLTDKNEFRMPFIMEPEDAAQEVFDFMTTNRFKKSFPRLFSMVFRVSQFLPDWLYYRLFKGAG